jgi:hypothetical protein
MSPADRETPASRAEDDQRLFSQGRGEIKVVWRAVFVVCSVIDMDVPRSCQPDGLEDRSPWGTARWPSARPKERSVGGERPRARGSGWAGAPRREDRAFKAGPQQALVGPRVPAVAVSGSKILTARRPSRYAPSVRAGSSKPRRGARRRLPRPRQWRRDQSRPFHSACVIPASGSRTPLVFRLGAAGNTKSPSEVGGAT